MGRGLSEPDARNALTGVHLVTNVTQSGDTDQQSSKCQPPSQFCEVEFSRIVASPAEKSDGIKSAAGKNRPVSTGMFVT
jgi:hypothetical protein